MEMKFKILKTKVFDKDKSKSITISNEESFDTNKVIEA